MDRRIWQIYSGKYYGSAGHEDSNHHARDRKSHERQSTTSLDVGLGKAADRTERSGGEQGVDCRKEEACHEVDMTMCSSFTA